MKRPTLPRTANTRAGRLTALREAKDITQDDIAAELGISRSRWSRIESGRCGITLEQLRAVAEFYGVSLDYLEYGRGASAGLPHAGELVDDPDELAWLDFWRRIKPEDKPAVFRLLGFRGKGENVG